MSNAKSFYDGVRADILAAIKNELRNYNPNLNRAIGVVKGESLPTTGPNAPGAPPGTGYPPADGSVTEGKIADGAVTEAKLAFDPATQAELDDEISARAVGDTVLAAPEYLTLALSGTLTNERRIVVGRGLTATDGGAGGDYTIAAALSGSGVWNWRSAAQTGDPGAQNAGVNHDAPSSATILYVNKNALNNIDYSGLLSAVRSGDSIYLQQADNAASWHRYDVTGVPTLTTNAYAIPVSTLGGSAQGTEPANNADVYIVINGASAGGSLTDPFPVHGIRVALGSNAAALYVPWQSGDTLATIGAGSSNASNNQPAIYAESYSSFGLLGVATTGVPIGGRKVGTVTNAIGVAMNANHRSTGTIAAGFGSALRYQLQSSTTADQDAARISAVWSDPTHVSRSAYLEFATVNNAAALAERARLTAPGALWLGKTSSGLTGAGDLDVAGNARIDGTLTLAAKSANQVFAGPSSGAAAAPTFRILAEADIPAIAYTKLTYSGLTTNAVLQATSSTTAAFGALDLSASAAVTGTLPVARGGTGVAIIPFFSVHKNGTNQTGLATGVYTKLTWSTEAADTNNNFASDKFTPTVAGTYLMILSVQWTTAVDQALMLCAIYKNGAAAREFSISPSGGNQQIVLGVAMLTANGSSDYFEGYAGQLSGSNKDVNGSASVTYFMGIWIGP